MKQTISFRTWQSRLFFNLDVEAANFRESGSWTQEKGTAFTSAIHIERQKLECDAIFCKIYDEK